MWPAIAVCRSVPVPAPVPVPVPVAATPDVPEFDQEVHAAAMDQFLAPPPDDWGVPIKRELREPLLDSPSSVAALAALADPRRRRPVDDWPLDPGDGFADVARLLDVQLFGGDTVRDMNAGADDTETGNDTERERERLRQRQRTYEKRYRRRKRSELKQLRRVWLELEMRLHRTRKARLFECVCTRQPRSAAKTKSDRLRELKLQERALLHDRASLQSLRALASVALIREYTDKPALRSRREWQHSSEKIFGPCALDTPHRLPPFTFTW